MGQNNAIFRKAIKVDKCLVKEIRELNRKGVETLYSCCGHGGQKSAFISVRETLSSNLMYRMDYLLISVQQLNIIERGEVVGIIENHNFKPKSKCHCRLMTGKKNE